MIPAVFHPGIPRSWRHVVSWGFYLALAGMVWADLMEVTHIFHQTHPRLLWLGVMPADPSFLRAVVPSSSVSHTVQFPKVLRARRGVSSFFILFCQVRTLLKKNKTKNCYLLSLSLHTRKDILAPRTKFENKGRFFLRKGSWQLYSGVARKKRYIKAILNVEKLHSIISYNIICHIIVF